MKNDYKNKFKSSYLYAGITAFLVVAACVLFFFLIYKMNGIFSYIGKFMSVLQPLIFGFVIAYLVNPIANSIHGLMLKLTKKYFKNRKLARTISNGVSVVVALAVFVAIILAIVYLIVPQFIESMSSLVTVLPNQVDNAIDWSTSILQKNEEFEDVIVTAANYVQKWFEGAIKEIVNTYATYVATGVWSVVTFFKNFAIGLMFAIYILFNKQLLVKQLRKLLFACFQNSFVKHLINTAKKTNSIFSGFIYGKLLDSFIIGILCFIGVTILKIPYTMLVAVIVGVTNVIPVFGPYIGAVPCALLILLASPIKCLYFVIFIILLQALDGNFIGPKILGSSTGLSAFWVITAITLGGGMFGVLGMLIGVPLFAVIYYLFAMFVNYRIEKKKLPLDSNFYDANVCDKLENPAGELQEEIPLDTIENK